MRTRQPRLPALRCVQRGTSASGFRAHRQEMGQAGLLVPFHHIRAKGGLARPRGGLFARGLQDRHGDFRYSFIRMAKLAEPLMKDGGCLLTMTYYGAEKVVEYYNIMGPVKAALECAVCYMASELGPKGIRVHAISPGPIKTRAASGIDRFEELLDQAARRAPIHHRITTEDVGAVAACLVSDAAAALTGLTVYADAGYHILG